MLYSSFRSWKRIVLVSLVALAVGSAGALAVAQIDEPSVTIKSDSDIEFTIDSTNDPNVLSFFEVFSPSSDRYPFPFFWLTEDGRQFMRGTATIDVSHRSGAPGRTALFLNGSSDNVDVGIFVNRRRLFVWSTLDNNRADLIIRNLQATGTKSAVIETKSSGGRAIYAVESPEVWVEDYGSAHLTNGEAKIALDPLFLEAVSIDDTHPLKVFVQLTAEANPVIVTKADTYFIVKETEEGRSNATFDYRVVAKRQGFEDTRFEKVPLEAK